MYSKSFRFLTFLIFACIEAQFWYQQTYIAETQHYLLSIICVNASCAQVHVPTTVINRNEYNNLYISDTYACQVIKQKIISKYCWTDEHKSSLNKKLLFSVVK